MPSGDYFLISRGEHDDPARSTAAAYYLTADGDVVFLEPPASGAKNRVDLDRDKDGIACEKR